MASSYGYRFDSVLRELRKVCPVSIPIKVVTKSLGKHKLCGCCNAYLTPTGEIARFLIEIDNSMSQQSAVDSLLHEWAHALDQEENGIPLEPHRSSWGECYARVWRCYTSMPS